MCIIEKVIYFGLSIEYFETLDLFLYIKLSIICIQIKICTTNYILTKNILFYIKMVYS